MQLAPLDNSVVFKKLFRDPEILTAFFKDLTGIQLTLKPENIELEKKFDPPIGLIDIAFDIFAEDPEQRIVVEIQRVENLWIAKEFLKNNTVVQRCELHKLFSFLCLHTIQ